MRTETQEAYTQAPLKVLMLDLFCVTPYYTGRLCRALVDLGVDVDLASISYQYDRTCFKRQNIENDPGLLDLVARWSISKAPLRQALKLLECLINLAALAVRLAVRPPDVVHVQFIPLVKKRLPFELWFLALARRRGCKIAYTVHNELPMDTGGRHLATFRNLYHEMDVLVCHTPDARSRVMERFGVPADRIQVVPHGPMFNDTERCPRLRARSRLGLAPNEFIVLWQGFVKPYKGVPLLLDAWQRIHKREPRVRLIIAGSGEDNLLREIHESVERLQLSESVRLELRFMPVEEMSLYYQSADALVYPYKEITTSGALMTGLSYGKAIIATALPGFQQVLEHGKCALLVPPDDSSALAEAIEHLLHHPRTRADLSREAARLAAARQISWRSIAEMTQQVYTSLVTTDADISPKVEGPKRLADDVQL